MTILPRDVDSTARPGRRPVHTRDRSAYLHVVHGALGVPTCRQLWPQVTPVCTSAPLTLEEYGKTIGNAAEVVDMIIGDLQRVMEYPKRGFADEQAVPPVVVAAYDWWVAAGFNTRLLQ